MTLAQHAIVVINAGSSSLKFSVFVQKNAALHLHAHGQLGALLSQPYLELQDATGQTITQQTWPEGTVLSHDEALSRVIALVRHQTRGMHLIGVGHRVVHGGPDHAQPVRVSPEVLEKLERYIPLAPLHQPHNLAAIRAIAHLAPELPQVACFDTAFHRTHTELAQMFALPYSLHEAGIRRYGFHGLSYEYIASILPQIDQQATHDRTVIMHLGNGASMCALHAGRSIASTMGFTALDGLPMGTRSGNLDPGAVLYLIKEHGMRAEEVEQMLYHQSGLLGVSGVSSDMRTLLASQLPRSRLAVDLFVYRIQRELGSLAAALGGLDSLVFTAGIGEHSSEIRTRVCQAAAWLGIEIDQTANAATSSCISTHRSRVSVWVIPTDEAHMIAQHTAQLLRE